MKKFAIAVMFIAGFALACGGGGGGSQLKDPTDSFQSEGWLDDNTFQVRTLGAPNPDAKGFVRRRTQSEEAALLAAQKRVIELLVGAKIEGASNSDSGELGGLAISKEFEGVVKGGSIVRKTFDAEDNCEITYRIHRDGLREMAESEAKKNDFRE